MGDAVSRSLEVVQADEMLPPNASLRFALHDTDCLRVFPICLLAVRFRSGEAARMLTVALAQDFRNADRAAFLGVAVRIPAEYEAYLDFGYGAWREPQPDMSWHESTDYRAPKTACTTESIL